MKLIFFIALLVLSSSKVNADLVEVADMDSIEQLTKTLEQDDYNERRSSERMSVSLRNVTNFNTTELKRKYTLNNKEKNARQPNVKKEKDINYNKIVKKNENKNKTSKPKESNVGINRFKKIDTE